MLKTFKNDSIEKMLIDQLDKLDIRNLSDLSKIEFASKLDKIVCKIKKDVRFENAIEMTPEIRQFLHNAISSFGDYNGINYGDDYAENCNIKCSTFTDNNGSKNLIFFVDYNQYDIFQICEEIYHSNISCEKRLSNVKAVISYLGDINNNSDFNITHVTLASLVYTISFSKNLFVCDLLEWIDSLAIGIDTALFESELFNFTVSNYDNQLDIHDINYNFKTQTLVNTPGDLHLIYHPAGKTFSYSLIISNYMKRSCTLNARANIGNFIKALKNHLENKFENKFDDSYFRKVNLVTIATILYVHMPKNSYFTIDCITNDFINNNFNQCID